MDFEQMAKNAEAERAEKDKHTISALNKLADEHSAKQTQWNKELYTAVTAEKKQKAKMDAEIAEIQAEADKRIQSVKDRYASVYGRKSWNSTLDESLKDLSNDIMKNR